MSLQHVILVLAMLCGMAAACDEAGDNGILCGINSDGGFRCNCPWATCSGEFPHGECKATAELIVMLVFIGLAVLIIVMVGSWLCCCRGDGCSWGGCCTGGCCCRQNQTTTVVAEPAQPAYPQPAAGYPVAQTQPVAYPVAQQPGYGHAPPAQHYENPVGPQKM